MQKAMIKYEKQDQQGKAAFNERNPHMTQQQEPTARSKDNTFMKLFVLCLLGALLWCVGGCVLLIVDLYSCFLYGEMAIWR
jgi:uncharacterized protein YydD (DUF2326 family)